MNCGNDIWHDVFVQKLIFIFRLVFVAARNNSQAIINVQRKAFADIDLCRSPKPESTECTCVIIEMLIISLKWIKLTHKSFLTHEP